MKNILKDFLFFNQRDRNAIVLLLVLIGIAGLYSIYINSLSKLDPSHFILQEQIEKEFKAYEEDLELKEVVSEDNDDVEKSSILQKDQKKQNKTRNSKLTKGQVVNINKASAEILTKIPGIGNTLAQRIVEYRRENGYFDNIEQLLAIKEGKKILFEGIVEGTITEERRGNSGFGYDSIFQPNGYNKTFAELTLDEKNTISHRARALDQLVLFLRKK